MSCRGECLQTAPGTAYELGRHAGNCVDNPERRTNGDGWATHARGRVSLYRAVDGRTDVVSAFGCMIGMVAADLDDLRHLMIEDLAKECDRLREQVREAESHLDLMKRSVDAATWAKADDIAALSREKWCMSEALAKIWQAANGEATTATLETIRQLTQLPVAPRPHDHRAAAMRRWAAERLEACARTQRSSRDQPRDWAYGEEVAIKAMLDILDGVRADDSK